MKVRVTYWPQSQVSIQSERDLGSMHEMVALKRAMNDWMETPVAQWIHGQENIQASVWMFDFDGEDFVISEESRPH